MQRNLIKHFNTKPVYHVSDSWLQGSRLAKWVSGLRRESEAFWAPTL